MSKGNYVSVKNNVAIIEKQFKQEQAEGLMQEVPYATAKKELGADFLLTDLADFEKSDDSFRVIHDGTYDVKANLRIRLMDQGRLPGIAEKQFIVQRAQD